MRQVKMSQFTNETSKEVFEETYCIGNETIEDVHTRVAKTMASVEKEPEFWEEEFRRILRDFAFVPGGRILANAGNEGDNTMINCFVSGVDGGRDIDSLDSIFAELTRQGKILSSEGGYGFCCSFMRPRGSRIKKKLGLSPGPVEILNMWDTQSKVITSGAPEFENTEKKKVRKGAQMVTMHIWHPDIELFIKAKQTPGVLTKFNMSLLMTDDFVKAVEKHEPWNLVYPDIEDDQGKYEKEWTGDIKDWTGKVKIHKTYEDANELYDIIMESTYNRNEPGVLFIDTINNTNNLKHIENIQATNPCGEQVLPRGGVCLLGSLNLTQFIKESQFDYEKFEEYINIAVRFLDNVNDITKVPLQENYDNMKQKRRIGLGVMGYGSALMLLGLRYGSEEALEFTDTLMYFLRNRAYCISTVLAREKGAFPLYTNQEPILLGERRNSHLLSIQPTGNTGTAANLVSTGIEPVFCYNYIRTRIVGRLPESLGAPTVDFENRVCDSDAFEWIQEGDEHMLRTKEMWDGHYWKIDKSRGYLKEILVEDYAVTKLKEQGVWNENDDHIVCTRDLSVNDHVNTLGVFANYVCSSISKTVNIPSDYPYDDFKQMYLNAHSKGIKGITTYRDGTMASVLSAVTDPVPTVKTEKRPVEVECDLHGGDEWLVLVGKVNDLPYEVFAFKQQEIVIRNVLKGKLVKIETGKYDFVSDTITIRDICSRFEKTEHTALTRSISLNLRSGVTIERICEQLDKSDIAYMTICSYIAKTLMKYVRDPLRCPSCKKATLVVEDGCMSCKDCMYSKCS